VRKTKKTLTLGGRCSLRESPAAAGGERCVDLFVVQQEIDELRDLNVVNCDLGPVLGGDDQVQLPGAPLYLYTPRRFRRFGRQRRPEHADAIAKCAWSRRTLRVPGPCRASRSVTVCRFLDPAHRPLPIYASRSRVKTSRRSAKCGCRNQRSRITAIATGYSASFSINDHNVSAPLTFN